jgi:hypothetical protein
VICALAETASDNMAVAAATLVFIMYQSWIKPLLRGTKRLRSVPQLLLKLICDRVNMFGQRLTDQIQKGLQFSFEEALMQIDKHQLNFAGSMNVNCTRFLFVK